MRPTHKKNFTLMRRTVAIPLTLLLVAGTVGCSAKNVEGGDMSRIDPPEIELPGEESEPTTAIMTHCEQKLVLAGSPIVWTAADAEGADQPTRTASEAADSSQSNGARDALEADGTAPNGEQVAPYVPAWSDGEDKGSPCWLARFMAGVASWDQVNDTAAGNVAEFESLAPDGQVSSTTDDTAAVAGVSLGATFPGLGTSLGNWVLIPEASLMLQQAGDYEAVTEVRANGRAVRSTSTFDPDLALGLDVGLAFHRGPWSITPFAGVLRQSIDVEIENELIFGDMTLDRTMSKKDITETNFCFGATAAYRLRQLIKGSMREQGGALGLRWQQCELNDATYNSYTLQYGMYY